MGKKSFDGVFEMPLQGRMKKPRENGVTMLIDKGLGMRATADLLEMAGDAIDMVKFTFGTSAFIDDKAVLRKTDLLRSNEVWVMPGGTFFEVAFWQGRYPEYLKRWNGLPGTVAVASLKGPAVQRGKKILWVRDPKNTVVAEVPVTSGDGTLLFSQLDIRPHLDPTRSTYDPVADRILWNMLARNNPE